jgi:hypothetical protein
MTLELLAEFDHFLSEHIRNYGKVGRSNIVSIFTDIRRVYTNSSRKNIKQIVEEVKVSKYFSINVDSTPGVSHVDQLSFIIRYLLKDGSPIE